MNSSETKKRLVPATIIPPDLYVERDADRQLASNVRDMGRPGYVLVARQMGKTNLLIHAKRTLQSATVRIVYVDLSVAAYNDERECFRHIVDTAINSHRDLFESAEIIISDKRKQLRPPNSEHDSELRTLLTHTDSKLIIILDEIDSLVNAEFSDRIFAHIRSVYFSRINYPELDRLGYVLSGVVEPNEIIKDKKISPFNIGEKIYLNDFSQNEIHQFLSQAQLDLEKAAIERLIFWTGGNPRMLWDICSQLEDQITQSSTATTPEIIDETVNKFYLTNFDHAPIDHIRELVRENSDVRSAVRALVTNEGRDLTDTVRTKLYLFGIIKASSSIGTPTIKNAIIAKSLSIEWIKSLASDQRSIFSQAQEQYERKRYSGALQGYREYLEACDEDDQLRALTWYQCGMCEYYLGNFADALVSFNNITESKTKELSSSRYMVMGICNYYLNNYNESIKLLETALNGSADSDLNHQIKLNLGSALLNRGQDSDLDEAERIFADLATSLSSTTNEEVVAQSKQHLQTAAFYNLGTLHQQRGENNKATDSFINALLVADNYSLPTIYIRLAEVAVDSEHRLKQLGQAVQISIANNLFPIENHPEQPLALSVTHSFELITQLVREGLDDLLNSFLGHLDQASQHQKKPRSIWLKEAANHALSKRRRKESITLYKLALLDSQIENHVKLECIGWLVLLDPNPILEKEYLALLASGDSRPQMSALDIRNLSALAQIKLSEKKWREALEVVRNASRSRDTVDPPLICNFLGLDLIEMICLDNLGDRASIPNVASRALKLSDSLPKDFDKRLLYFRDEDLKYAHEYATFHSKSQSVQLRLPTKAPVYGRNAKVTVRYTDGKTLTDIKFKKIEADLANGLCEILQLEVN